jgi:hypothetical protein
VHGWRTGPAPRLSPAQATRGLLDGTGDGLSTPGRGCCTGGSDATEYVRISDEGEERSHFFCPRCGATGYWSGPEGIGVPVGAFADPNFPAPRVSVWEDRMHPWVGLPDGIEHIS